MSWGQYLLLQRGYWQKQNRQWEEDWRRTRELFWLGWNANAKKEDQKRREQLLPLPSDPKPKKRTKQDQERDTIAFFDALAAFDVSEN